MKSRYVLVLVLTALLVVFILQNVEDVEIRFLFWSLGMSRALMVILLIAAGAVIGWAAGGKQKKGKQKEDNG
jgi:putative membrane protein